MFGAPYSTEHALESGAMLATARLVLRPWRPDDLPALAALNADPAVMEHFPNPLDRAESDALAARLQAHIDAHGFGFWAVERTGAAGCIGFIGLARVGDIYPFHPAIEVGWRLARAHWGQGYASEGARACLAHAFGVLGVADVVAFAVAANWRSRRVVTTIGMTHDASGDFDHPKLAEGHRLRRHVLYRVRAPDREAGSP
jgi:ribosomal-protein-alanine N-acetyltransferase